MEPESVQYAYQTVNLLAGKWRILILTKINDGVTRPAGIVKEIPRLSKKVLHSELKALIEQNLIYRDQIKNSKVPWVEYKLTAFGEKLLEIVIHLQSWGHSNAALFQKSEYTDKVNMS